MSLKDKFAALGKATVDAAVGTGQAMADTAQKATKTLVDAAADGIDYGMHVAGGTDPQVSFDSGVVYSAGWLAENNQTKLAKQLLELHLIDSLSKLRSTRARTADIKKCEGLFA